MPARSLLRLFCGVCLLSTVFTPPQAVAEDCTGVLPGGNCTLDEDTTAALTIDNGVVLTIDADVVLGHTIDGSGDNQGTIATSGNGVAITQSRAIGNNATVDSLSIEDGDSWTTTADIRTNGDGGDANDGTVAADIDLDVVTGGETLTVNNGATITGTIEGNAGDTVNVGADMAGGSFLFRALVGLGISDNGHSLVMIGFGASVMGTLFDW
jgi:hypothetical protein